MWMDILHTCMSMYHFYAWCQKRVLDPLGLEVQIIMSHYVGAGNETSVLWKGTHDLNCWAIPPAPLFDFYGCWKRLALEMCFKVLLLWPAPLKFFMFCQPLWVKHNARLPKIDVEEFHWLRFSPQRLRARVVRKGTNRRMSALSLKLTA